MGDIVRTAGWAPSRPWPINRKAPAVVVLAGIDRSGIVDAALADPVLAEQIIVRLEPTCSPPCDAVLWRLETPTGEPLRRTGLRHRYWHRKPYALTVRLVRYQSGSTVPEILDEGTIGTRGKLDAFLTAVDRLAMRLVRDTALGHARGASGSVPTAAPSGAPGWLDHARARWQDRLMTEWWSLGTSAASIDRLSAGDGLGPVHWFCPAAADRYLADPFPWPGTDRILAEEMPVRGGVGRIVAVTETAGGLLPVSVVLDDGAHHSYPCAWQEGDTVWCIPEATDRGATWLYSLDRNGRLQPICGIAPHARLADPTLFHWNDRYWIACTDLDLGAHDNLCLLHAASLAGPWRPHALWPVKIDIRSARPAGAPWSHAGRLYRPAQDCAATYGAAIALHEIVALNETMFHETLVSRLVPDPAGPFPHGLHTLNHDGERFWVDGKRFVLDAGLLRRKLGRKASHAWSSRIVARDTHGRDGTPTALRCPSQPPAEAI